DYSRFHLRQQGTALAGCYEYDEGVFSGSVEGRVMRIAWQESGGPESGGPAVMVFAPGGRSFRGHYWHGTDRGRAPDGVWNGEKLSDAVGSCPHWSGSVGGEVARALAAEGRARLYGIEFDLDSAAIRPESGAVLDDVARALAAHPEWRLAIEGHTDATGTAAHNQELSAARAAAVRDALAARGVSAERLRTLGFGSSRPVSDNATALGRARNRRVEIVRE
ncbi:MAG TPA: OmpA family protein, partial [Thermoanaerobaculia bacterium]|nr:OmpA family protein [Thermoanaerobaculia bacterium]